MLSLLPAARIQAHWAIQLLAAVSSTLIDPVADDSHTSMEWAWELHAFVSMPIVRVLSSALLYACPI